MRERQREGIGDPTKTYLASARTWSLVKWKLKRGSGWRDMVVSLIAQWPRHIPGYRDTSSPSAAPPAWRRQDKGCLIMIAPALQMRPPTRLPR